MNSNMTLNIFRYISLAAIPLLLSGCYQDIDLDKYKEHNGEHLLTINSIINPDSTISVAATRTYFFQDVHNERSYVKDLDIYIYVNGENRGRMDYDSKSQMYVSDVKPDECDEISLRTMYGDSILTASDIVPEKVRIESVTVSRQGPLAIYTDRDYILTYNITFTDPVGTDNFYFLQYDTTDWRHGLMMGERDFTYEYVFQQLARHINVNVPGWIPYSSDGLPFSDYGIDGETHTLIVKEIVQGGNGIDLTRYIEMNRRFKLFSISEDYYNYLVSVIYNDSGSDGLHGGMINLGITEPIKYFSNINGGVGIFVAYTLDKVDLDVMNITGKFPK